MIDLAVVYAPYTRDALAALYTTALDAYDAGQAAAYAAAVAAIDFDRVTDVTMLIGLATTLLWPKLVGADFPERDSLVARVDARVHALMAHDAAALMRGLL